MPKLRLGVVESDKPVKLSIELPASIHRDLCAYSQAHATETGQEALEPSKLVPAMLARFMATDRGFAKYRQHQRSSQPA